MQTQPKTLSEEKDSLQAIRALIQDYYNGNPVISPNTLNSPSGLGFFAPDEKSHPARSNSPYNRTFSHVG